MRLAVPNADPIKIDLIADQAPMSLLSGYVLAWLEDSTGSADFITWHAYCKAGATELDCESGNYFHLSPGYTPEDKQLAYSQACADYNRRRGVEIPPF